MIELYYHKCFWCSSEDHLSENCLSTTLDRPRLTGHKCQCGAYTKEQTVYLGFPSWGGESYQEVVCEHCGVLEHG